MAGQAVTTPRILGVAHALPEHYYDQETLLVRLEKEWQAKHYNPDRLRRLHENVLVGGRHLALPIERYDALSGFGATNDAWIEAALELGERAVTAALEGAAVSVGDVSAVFFVSVTGLATPSLDARLMNRIAFKPDLKRIPIFGLGCLAGAAGTARASEYVRAFPGEVAVLLSVELCSLTLQREDLSIPNLIASGLFGDGAAAVVLGGENRASSEHPLVVDTASSFYRDTEGVMGWQISERGFQVVLSAEVPKMVDTHLRRDVDAFLARHGLTVAEIEHWVCHPGGPKVLEAMARTLELPAAALERTWRSLREVGNLSSTSVLLVLEETLREGAARPGDHGVMLAMGPGFSSELVLLRWPGEESR